MTDENSILMSTRSLCLRRGSFALKNITLDVYENEILSILGKTGSGKTMLLECMAGFYRPDSGEVRYKDENVNDIPVYRRNIGYLYQDYCLFPHMTVEKNIGYGLKMQKQDKNRIKMQVREIAEQFDIAGVLRQYPGTLSGGEQQRVALARALVTRPKLLILDEPFSALDPVTKQKMYDMVRKIRQDFCCTVIFVTHDFAEAEHLSDRTGVMISGELCGVVESSKLYTAAWDSSVRDFLGIEHFMREI